MDSKSSNTLSRCWLAKAPPNAKPCAPGWKRSERRPLRTGRGVEQLRIAADAARARHRVLGRGKAKALVDAEASTRGVSDQLQLLARDLDEHPTFQPLARPARQIADVENAGRPAPPSRPADVPAMPPNDCTSCNRADDNSRSSQAKSMNSFISSMNWPGATMTVAAFACWPSARDDLADQLDKAAKAVDSRAIDPILAEQERLRRELDELLEKLPRAAHRGVERPGEGG